ncbi:hypothetical protein FHG66_16740 [Rubellimicrobium rubrum]|uniref:Uncharacterized protein n=1 Tax=Rubellimicrobium rubrum TaxID=2585369 RepID=A0A5C4MNK0_9RHOB|nr:hypothetical protein [Rubellimicrobium rubrum]TNC47395.1 hypothetical protein FHG66_16740 [Rubellimicrobium rubrum]
MTALRDPIALAIPAPAQKLLVTLQTERDPVTIEPASRRIIAVQPYEQGVPVPSGVTQRDAVPPDRDEFVNEQSGPGIISEQRSGGGPALMDEPFEGGPLPKFSTFQALNLAKERCAFDIEDHDLAAPSCETRQAHAWARPTPSADGVGCRGRRLGDAGPAAGWDLAT